MNKKQFTHIWESLISLFRNAAPALTALGLLLAGNERTSATILYATSSSPSAIYQDNSLVPLSNTLYFTPLKTPDSLMFDSMGNVIYTAISAGEVRSYNPNTTVDSLVASGLPGPPFMTSLKKSYAPGPA